MLTVWGAPHGELSDIILDIYRHMTELGETDYEQLQTDLYAIHESPIDLNNTSEEELSGLYFLSPKQIDEILMYADRHPFETVYELRMIEALADYEIRNLLPFVRIGDGSSSLNKLRAREVFRGAGHEIITRVDARNIENEEGPDPMYVQGRYRFDYQRRVTAGVQLRRPAGGGAEELQYGAYIQVRDIGHLHTLVGGNFQASFGQGLVLAPVFHTGKTMYVASIGQQAEALRYYSSVDGEGLHGIGSTWRWEKGKQWRVDATALYSLRKANDSTWHHLVGANISMRYKRLQVQVSGIENIWSDSIRPYRNAAYNVHYFRGRSQAVVGASARYNYGWGDAFAEVATAQNEQWGVGVLAGSRFYPASGVSLIALYRYYSPYFDNVLGYAFSETSRLGDENGGYIGWDITRWKGWRVTGYGDVFYFSGPKYGLPDGKTVGYDAMIEGRYSRALRGEGEVLSTAIRVRSRKKGDYTHSVRVSLDWSNGTVSLRTSGEGNIGVSGERLGVTGYGVSVAQDVSYSPRIGDGRPLTMHVRLQGFDAREWANRIYMYEHDVLYGFSVPAVYGLGGRAYVCMRWQVIRQLALYLRVSETVYARSWAAEHDRAQTRTDVHLLVRVKL